jgi:hypothetical protein
LHDKIKKKKKKNKMKSYSTKQLNAPAKNVSDLQNRLEFIVAKSKALPAKNIPDLKVRLKYLVMQFPLEARQGIIAESFNKMTGEDHKDGYTYSNCYGDGDCPGGRSLSANGQNGGCDKKQYSNFNTNFRDGGLQDDAGGFCSANGSTGRVASSNVKSAGTVFLMLAAVAAIGILLVSQGEKQRQY